MSETQIMRAIRLAVNSSGKARIFRNTIGLLYTRDGTPNRVGLSKGSGDLIGFTNTGKFISLEVKTAKGRVDPDQEAWKTVVKRFGGVAEIVRSVEEAMAVIEKECK